MVSLSQDCLRWVLAVLNQWQALVTGGIITAAITAVQYYRQKSFPWSTNKWMLVGFLLLAFFLAWREQKVRADTVEARLRAPDMTIELGLLAVSFAGKANQDTLVTLGGTINNPLGPASAVDHWEMDMVFEDSTTIQGDVPLVPDKDLQMPLGDGRKLTLTPAKYWPAVTAAPLQAGAIASGWIVAGFKGINKDRAMTSKPTIVLRFTDAFNKVHSISKPWGGSGSQNIIGLEDLLTR